jgi:peptide/nickel transport system permease protein
MSDRVVQIAEEPDWGSLRGKYLASTRYLARNPSLVLGLVLLGALVLFSGVGRVFVDVSTAAPLSAPPTSPPSEAFPLGSDPQGRNLLAVMIEGTWLTIRTGVIAGALGIALGGVLVSSAPISGAQSTKSSHGAWTFS